MQHQAAGKQGLEALCPNLGITHHIGVVEYIADAIVEQGACAKALGRPAREYTRALLAAVPRVEAARKRLPAP
jgi:ABC-type dipeptide/oligopeptide/nickel transport system ATPase component